MLYSYKCSSARWLNAIICFLLISSAFCQSTQKTFSHLTVDEGLSHSSVYTITQDNRGFMWFGTRDGLNRYDSRNVVVYQNQSTRKNSLASNTINSLLVDKQGRLWVGTAKGLALYRPEQDDFQRMLTGGPANHGLPDSTINWLLEDHQQALWIGTQGGLYRLNRQQQFEPLAKLLQHPKKLHNRSVRTLYEDSDRTLWVGTTNGLLKLRPTASGKFQLTSYFLEPTDSVYTNALNTINTIAEDRAGRLWIGTEGNGIALFDKQRGRVTSWNPVAGLDLNTLTVRTIQPDGRSNFWIGTMSGLYIVAQDGSHFQTLSNQPTDPNSLGDNSVRSIFRDRDGSFWVGTYYGGVDMYSPLARQFGSYHLLDKHGRTPFKIAGPIVPAYTPNQLWVGTEDRGLLLINSDKTILRHYTHDARNTRSLSNDKIKCLLADGPNGLWIGTIKGLNYLDFQRRTITRYLHDPHNPHSLPNDRIYDLKRDAQGAIWVVTNLGGICRFVSKTQSFERIGATLPNMLNNGTTLLFDSQGQMWFSNAGGLLRKRAGEHRVVRFFHADNDPGSLSNNHVMCLLEDRKHRLWIGTRDGGLNLLLPNKNAFHHFTTAQGLPSNTIFSIQEDQKGSLWVSTDKGLAQLAAGQSTFTAYNVHDGLVCREFTSNSAYQDATGHLYFGGYNGIVYFHPDSIQRNTTVHPLAFTGLRLFNEPVTSLSSDQSGIDYQQGITLTHRQNVFSLDFASFNYINAAKNRYAYRLIGFDQSWNYVSEPRAMYMNLPAGEYLLQAKGANNDSVWNKHPLELKITVLPPLWKTPWAYALYALTFLGLLQLWSRFNRNRLQLAHELEEEHREKARQQELHQIKLNFFTEIAHEIRTPLTLVMAPIEVLNERYATDPFIRKQLSIMRGSTDRLLRLLNQLLDFRKHETGNIQLQWRQTDLVAFLSNSTDSFREHARAHQLTLTNESDVSTLPAWFDAGELEKVVHNLLFNAVKFTPAGGTVSVRLRRDFPSARASEQAVITIEDTGAGIPAGNLDYIFNQFYQVGHAPTRDSGFGLGLALSKHIIEQHRGQITVESQEAESGKPGFTRFIIRLPLTPRESVIQTLAKSDNNQLPASSPLASPLPTESTSLLLNTVEVSEAGQPLILVVDDQEDIRAYIRDLFSVTCQVMEAADGAEALEMATQLLPDLVIADVAMPIMDGFSLTHRIKTDVRTSHIPVILLTAKNAVDNQLTGLQTGADDYVTKPFHPILLQTRVRNLLLLREQLRAKYHQIVTLQPQVQELDHPDEKFLNQLMTTLETHLNDAEFNVTRLVIEMGMSRPVLFRKVKMLTGLSVIDLIRTTRLKKAELLLKQRKASVAEIAFAVGFSDPKYFSRAFRAQFGVTPTEYSHQTAEKVEEAEVV
ncbi:hybrid sensor histidine kinase/response regulator transcription factor [Spirosoma aerolatum]|uniref:hybrid sensor histidine kinase/response regulator transcription factor n=1 Tax=Spirosoma aerolatum TaxID=1211326 RepID=UPI0009AE2F99|nr:two-component regulator propeller domain-containing protein [Spirosoma aerolatum]